MKTKFNLSTLKSLNIKECLGLAKYLYPDRKWQYQHNPPDEAWDGHDMTSGVFHIVTGYEAVLTIDFRENPPIEQPRVVLKIQGMQHPADPTKVTEYLQSINKL